MHIMIPPFWNGGQCWGMMGNDGPMTSPSPRCPLYIRALAHVAWTRHFGAHHNGGSYNLGLSYRWGNPVLNVCHMNIRRLQMEGHPCNNMLALLKLLSHARALYTTQPTLYKAWGRPKHKPNSCANKPSIWPNFIKFLRAQSCHM